MNSSHANPHADAEREAHRFEGHFTQYKDIKHLTHSSNIHFHLMHHLKTVGFFFNFKHSQLMQWVPENQY